MNNKKDYSTSSVYPEKSYSNSDTQKVQILQENKGKSGIYRWTNLENGKSYIGSSINLYRRFLEYFNTKYLLRKTIW